MLDAAARVTHFRGLRRAVRDGGLRALIALLSRPADRAKTPPGSDRRTRRPRQEGATSGCQECRRHDTHHRIRHERIDETGTVTLRVAGHLHHIGVGRAYARIDVILLVRDLHVTVVHAATAEVLRDLMIDPGKDHQPPGPPGPTKQMSRTCELQVRPIPMP